MRRWLDSTHPMGEVYEGESLAESSRAPKVNQLDADELDDALVSMLGEKVLRSIDNFKVSKCQHQTFLTLIHMFSQERHGISSPR